jgi:hypothetical protein
MISWHSFSLPTPVRDDILVYRENPAFKNEKGVVN